MITQFEASYWLTNWVPVNWLPWLMQVICYLLEVSTQLDASKLVTQLDASKLVTQLDASKLVTQLDASKLVTQLVE